VTSAGMLSEMAEKFERFLVCARVDLFSFELCEFTQDANAKTEIRSKSEGFIFMRRNFKMMRKWNIDKSFDILEKLQGQNLFSIPICIVSLS
jgi:hypothetical protein